MMKKAKDADMLNYENEQQSRYAFKAPFSIESVIYITS